MVNIWGNSASLKLLLFPGYIDAKCSSRSFFFTSLTFKAFQHCYNDKHISIGLECGFMRFANLCILFYLHFLRHRHFYGIGVIMVAAEMSMVSICFHKGLFSQSWFSVKPQHFVAIQLLVNTSPTIGVSDSGAFWNQISTWNLWVSPPSQHTGN